MDALADVLDVSGIAGTVLAHVRAHEPWGLDLSPDGAAFHAVIAGSCWLQLANQAPLRLMPGDVVLLPTGMRHQLMSAPGVPARVYDKAMKEELLTPEGDLLIEGSGTKARFLCAAYRYDREVAQPLLSLLPPVLHVPAADGHPDTPVQTTLRLLMGELGRREPGTRAVVERLIDVLFVHVVREWIESDDGAHVASWLSGLRDPSIAAALALLHERPEKPWTLDELAAHVHVSRSTLVRRFGDLVGEPPSAYLTRWRMDVAARRLRETDDPVGQVARQVGYVSEFAFSRAFSRIRGEAPGRYRRRMRDRALDAQTSVS
jgi:AraC-like DNA-binding protein